MSESASPPSASAPVPTDFPGTPDGLSGAYWNSLTPGKPVYPKAFAGPGDQYIVDAVSFGDKMVAVGSDRAGTQARGLIAVSSDGVSWTRPPDPDGIFDGVLLDKVLTDGRRILVLGQPPLPDGAQFDPGDTLAWTSSDGETWSEAPETGNPALDPSISSGDKYVFASHNGWFALAIDSTGGLSAARSVDGLLWTTSGGADHPFGGATVSSIAPFRGGFVAVGRRPSPLPDGMPIGAAWWSPDGTHWFDSAVDEGGPIRHAVAAVDGVVGLGSPDYPCFCMAGRQIWVSKGGKVWGRSSYGTDFAEYESDDHTIVLRSPTNSWQWTWDAPNWHTAKVPDLGSMLVATSGGFRVVAGGVLILIERYTKAAAGGSATLDAGFLFLRGHI